jgi:hypothetical protein
MKPVVVFYSYSGLTRRLAKDIALIVGGELRELKPEKPYSFSYNTAVKEARAEIEKGYCPPLSQGAESLGETQVIFIGSPNWLKTFAPPIRTFLHKVDLRGKTIIPFCTHGGGGFGKMMEEYRASCPASTVQEGIALKSDYDFENLERWLSALTVLDKAL